MPEPVDLCDLVLGHASARIAAMLELSGALKAMKHGVSKGSLRELLVSGLLRGFLPSPLKTTSGIVFNTKTQQSQQMDVVIIDERVLPPLIGEQGLGVIPSRAVIATVEVKSRLRHADLVEASDAASGLSTICDQESVPRDGPVLAYVFAFHGRGANVLRKDKEGRDWLDANAKSLVGVAVAGSVCWMKVQNEWRRSKVVGRPRYEETKRFVALLADNCRTAADRNWRCFTKCHRDYLGAFIRG